jgi:hypothetical protein
MGDQKKKGCITRWLLSQTLCNTSLVLEIDVPAIGFSGFVLQCESEDGVCLLHGIFSLSIGRSQSSVDIVESLRRGESICKTVSTR